MKANDIQAEVYTALTSIQGAAVYDEVPESAELPFIVIGEDSFESAADCLCYANIKVEVFSSCRGYRQVKDLTAEIADRLGRMDGFLSIEGMTFDRYSEDVRHAEITARYITA